METLFGSRQCCLNTLVLRHLERGFVVTFVLFLSLERARDMCVSRPIFARGPTGFTSFCMAWRRWPPDMPSSRRLCAHFESVPRHLYRFPAPDFLFLCVQGCNSSRS